MPTTQIKQYGGGAWPNWPQLADRSVVGDLQTA
jgi:hypothetical protein